MSKYHIDVGIPIPPDDDWAARKLVDLRDYPFDEMLVGDSFVVPHREVSRVRYAKEKYERSEGGKFVTRNMYDGIRVWRVA